MLGRKDGTGNGPGACDYGWERSDRGGVFRVLFRLNHDEERTRNVMDPEGTGPGESLGKEEGNEKEERRHRPIFTRKRGLWRGWMRAPFLRGSGEEYVCGGARRAATQGKTCRNGGRLARRLRRQSRQLRRSPKRAKKPRWPGWEGGPASLDEEGRLLERSLQ